MNKDDTDIVVRVIPIEQAHLEIKLRVYQSLLKLLYENSETTIDGGTLNVKLNINTTTQSVLLKIKELETELENYKPKQHIIKAPITKPASAESIEGPSL